eukprot:443355_1
MSTEDGFDLSPHLNSIQTFTEQYSQLIQSFHCRLTSLENAMKNCESSVHKQQITYSQLLNRIQSLEQKNEIKNKSPSIETIISTQLDENINNNENENNENKNEYELEEMELDLTNNSNNSNNLSSSQPLILNNNININNTNIINNNNASMPILEQETQFE